MYISVMKRLNPLSNNIGGPVGIQGLRVVGWDTFYYSSQTLHDLTTTRERGRALTPLTPLPFINDVPVKLEK